MWNIANNIIKWFSANEKEKKKKKKKKLLPLANYK